MSDNTLLRLPFLSIGLWLVVFLIVNHQSALAADGPVKDLEKAIKSGKQQILFAGKENEDLTIKKGIAVTGTSPDKALISGDIKMENGSSLANVTVSGKRTVIEIAKGASVTLSNVTVRGGADMGIYAPEGGGTLTVRNSRITKNRKGFYILPGKNLNLYGNVVSENKEEGLDVRAGTTGTITGNRFVNNGEGGAEIIAGSARLSVTGNTFAGNKSSGLAIQSYSGAGKAPGSVLLAKNTFSQNGDFGLTCISPSKGGAGLAFYRSTIKATDNTFTGNKRGVISPECGVSNRSSAEAAPPVEAAESPVTVIDRAALREEAHAYFEETVTLLHEREHLLEETLAHVEAALPWQKRLFQPALTSEAAQPIIQDIARINELRDILGHFPEEWLDTVLRERREAVVAESLRRMEELRQYFERLQKPLLQLR